MSAARKRAIAPIVIGVVGVFILILLGTWQLQRLAWKEGLIAEIEARIAADPVVVPDKPDPEGDDLLRVTARGTLGTQEIHALHSVKQYGGGYRIITPMRLKVDQAGNERLILVDLGFIPETEKDRIPRDGSVRWQERRPDDEVTGLLHWPEEVDRFTPDPDLGRNIWFARDVARMAEAMGTAPILLIAESHPDDSVILPQPPGVGLPNRHLEYALTWFGLAIVWAVMSIIWLRSEVKKARA
ncbi:MAG: SURF1 family protein [Pseudomonadota bacterium]